MGCHPEPRKETQNMKHHEIALRIRANAEAKIEKAFEGAGNSFLGWLQGDERVNEIVNEIVMNMDDEGHIVIHDPETGELTQAYDNAIDRVWKAMGKAAS